MNTKVSRLVLSLSLAACSESASRSSAQLVEIETTIQNGGSTAIERVEVAYEGARLRELTRFENGALVGSARPTYGAGGIVAIEYADGEGDRATEQLTYESGRLVRGRYEISGIRVDERTISYDATHGGALKEVSTLTTSPGLGNSTSLLRFEYDAAGRTTKLLELAGSRTDSTELRYTPDGALERATLFDGTDLRDTFTFSFDTEGRLAEVLDSRNGRHEVTYNEAGLIDTIRHSTSNGTTTAKYSYGAGSIEGWSFAPAVPVGQLFDLAGDGYDTVSLLHGDIAIPSELPRAVGNPDPDPDPQPNTCSFTPQDACETCLAASCCSEAEQCFAGSACDSYIQCAQPCTTQQCIDICGETNPQGKSDLQALQSCAQGFCPTSCAAN